jgi:hypothetical protein
VSASTLQLDEDPLLAAVGLLEANWISVQEIFELVNRVQDHKQHRDNKI